MPGAHLPNVLAARYASGPMADIWSPERKVVLERELWVAVMRAQHDLGLDLPLDVIDDHVAVIDKVDLASIEARERVTRHDVKARIEEFSALAGHERIHAGHDLARPHRERRAAPGARRPRARPRPDGHRAGPAGRAGRRARHPRDDRPQPQRRRRRPPRWASGSPTPARSCSRRSRRVEELLARYPLRGIKGPVGTQQDMLDLLGSPEKVAAARGGGGPRTSASRRRSPTSARCTRARSTSTWSPRSCRPAPGPASLATTIRLMAGLELATEGFQPGQVGSSAMPHKMNSRSCERINGLLVVLRGHLSMVGRAGRRPVERGRRLVLGRAPGRPARRVPRRRRAVRDVPHRARGLRRLPGGGRSASSSATCRSSPPPRCSWARCAPAPAARWPTRRSRSTRSRWRWRCASRAPPTTTCSTAWPPTTRLPLDRAALDAAIGEPLSFVGTAEAQVQAFVDQVAAVVARHPDAAAYRPEPIL